MEDVPGVRRTPGNVYVHGQYGIHALRLGISSRMHSSRDCRGAASNYQSWLRHRFVAATKRLLHGASNRTGNDQRIRKAWRGNEVDSEPACVKDGIIRGSYLQIGSIVAR